MSMLSLTLLAMFMLSLMGLALHQTHLLSTLLCLEAMMLILFISFSLLVLKFNASILSIAPMVLITFSACEASLGLSLLITTLRSHGTDHLQSMNLLQC